ncbi:SCAN domain-containing protein 3 [Eumeta japonica]|uniref:SCAN domain-containing protein 3 n=1 Tax=Eumeta variegata TaxID=151549 RepID=A0A4C1UHL4_EUMVA|nr:SCAN domain-containing protein 3 [Eumeta japonica]
MKRDPSCGSMFSSTSESNDDGLRASYNISLLMAKSGKPLTNGKQLILPAVEEIHSPSVRWIRCVIHRQHLVAKNLSDGLHQSLQFVINAVNKIRSNALNTHLFAQLYDENDEDFQRLLLHTEVRWLSKGRCLDKDIQTYVQHLIALHDDFKFRLEDILSMEISPWIINPFDETEVENVILQKELLELSTNEELKVTFKRSCSFGVNIFHCICHSTPRPPPPTPTICDRRVVELVNEPRHPDAADAD